MSPSRCDETGSQYPRRLPLEAEAGGRVVLPGHPARLALQPGGRRVQQTYLIPTCHIPLSVRDCSPNAEIYKYCWYVSQLVEEAACQAVQCGFESRHTDEFKAQRVGGSRPDEPRRGLRVRVSSALPRMEYRRDRPVFWRREWDSNSRTPRSCSYLKVVSGIDSLVFLPSLERLACGLFQRSPSG